MTPFGGVGDISGMPTLKLKIVTITIVDGKYVNLFQGVYLKQAFAQTALYNVNRPANIRVK